MTFCKRATGRSGRSPPPAVLADAWPPPPPDLPGYWMTVNWTAVTLAGTAQVAGNARETVLSMQLRAGARHQTHGAIEGYHISISTR